jgi:hypothetical protein
MLGVSIAALITVPIAWLFRDKPQTPHDVCDRCPQGRAACASNCAWPLRDPSYLYLNAGFFTCGFHIAFLVTHLPGNLQLCGLSATVAANSLALIGAFNVVGSLFVGWLGRQYRMKSILAWLYASRAAVVICYLWMPKTALNVYLIAGALGFSWLATVPPTAGLVGKLFGTRYLTTLFRSHPPEPSDRGVPGCMARRAWPWHGSDPTTGSGMPTSCSLSRPLSSICRSRKKCP